MTDSAPFEEDDGGGGGGKAARLLVADMIDLIFGNKQGNDKSNKVGVDELVVLVL